MNRLDDVSLYAAEALDAKEDETPELPPLTLEDPHALALKLVDMCREYWRGVRSRMS